MGSRLPSWILLLYLAIDLANPFVPGAVRFTQEEGLVWVEGTCPSREAAGVATADTRRVPPPLRRPSSVGESRSSTGPVPRLADWLVGVRTADPSARDLPQAESDDH